MAVEIPVRLCYIETINLTLSNTGSLPAAGIIVTDTLSTWLWGASFASTLIVTDTGYLPPYAWLVQDLAPGQSGVITVSAVLTRPLAAGTYTNTALVSAMGDLLAENNAAAVPFAVPNVAPSFTSAPLVTATQDAPYAYLATAGDDNGDALTIAAPTLPSWLTLEDHGDGTATLSGTPANADVGDHPVVLLVIDSGGLSNTQAFTITAANINDAPSFTSAPPPTATQDALYTYAVAATDPDLLHGDALTIAAPTLPSWLTLEDHGNGTATLSGTPANVDVGDHPVVLLVIDSGGLSGTQAFTITAANINDAPSFTSAPPPTATQDALYTYAVAATDPDLLHGDALAIAAPTLPSWLTLEDHGDGAATLFGTPGAGDVGQHPVVLRVTDSGGAFAEQEFVITVAGAEGPRCRIYLPLVFRNWQP